MAETIVVRNTIRPKFRIVKPAREHFKKFFKHVVRLFKQHNQTLPDDFVDELNKLWQSSEFRKTNVGKVIVLDGKTSYELISYTPKLPRTEYQTLREWYNQNKAKLSMKSFYQFLLAISLYFVVNKDKYKKLFVIQTVSPADNTKKQQSKLKNFRVKPNKSKTTASESKSVAKTLGISKAIGQQKSVELEESKKAEKSKDSQIKLVEYQSEINYEELADIPFELEEDTHDNFVNIRLFPVEGSSKYRRNREKHMLEMIYRIYEELNELKTHLNKLEEELRSLQAKYSDLKSDYEFSVSDIKSALESILALTNN